MTIPPFVTTFHQWLKEQWAALVLVFQPPLTGKKKIALVAIGLFVLAVFAGLNVVVYRIGASFSKIRQVRLGSPVAAAPTPTPTPRPFTYNGKMVLSVSTGGNPTGPKFRECFIDPLNPHTVKQQTFGVVIESEKPVTSAVAIVKTDNGSTEVPLALASGKATGGTWQGTWPVTDTAWYHYTITMRASDGTETRDAVVSLR